MNKDIKIKALDGSGSFSAFMSLPARRTPAPAIIVIQEIFGVNKNMRDICAHIAQTGYIAVCPDLFWRQEPDIQLTDQSEADWARAFQLYQGFNTDKGVDDLKATLSFIRGDKICTGRVGTMGYCLGGKLAWLMAARSDADCNISYYGVGIENLLDEQECISKPLLMHIAEKDKFVPPAAQTKILDAMTKNKQVSLHVYAGVDHAFARVGGAHYDQKAAGLANGRTADFLAKHLATDS